MGSDTTPNGIKFQFTDRFRPIAKRQLNMRAAGLDPKNVNLGSVKGKGSQGRVLDSRLCCIFLLSTFVKFHKFGHLIDEIHSN